MGLSQRLRIAIQKKGRLFDDSIELLQKCGLKIHYHNNTLLCHVKNLAIDLLFVRDDDIPTLVADQVCDLGIVGENILLEKYPTDSTANNPLPFIKIKELGFGQCRLIIAIPANQEYFGVAALHNHRIATTYSHLLQQFLEKQAIQATIVPLSGSVEIAPRLGIADAICDLVGTGQTLEANHLKEVATLIHSQAVLIKSNTVLSAEIQQTYHLLLQRITGALKAKESKYIMFHAPTHTLTTITQLLPGSETPTILPLDNQTDKVAVHVVATEGVFWHTLEALKQAGASSILVLPIEKMLD